MSVQNAVHNNLSIAASTYNRRGDFVFWGLDFSEILSIFIKASRWVIFRKRCFYEYPKAIVGDDPRRNQKTAPLYERRHYVQGDALPWNNQRKRTAFMQGRDAEKIQTTP